MKKMENLVNAANGANTAVSTEPPKTADLTSTATILENAKNLAADFSNSFLYSEYCRYKSEMQANPELLAKVEQYKQAQIALETHRLTHGSVDFNEERKIANQYTELTLHPIAGEFLQCEHQLLQLFATVFDIVNDACVME
ncbi:MAG: YlbF family regulator [Defluviitaleaceae bacterium]|nr:YlbF family regulator [Defluviitaleaceae bacterium]